MLSMDVQDRTIGGYDVGNRRGLGPKSRATGVSGLVYRPECPMLHSQGQAPGVAEYG